MNSKYSFGLRLRNGGPYECLKESVQGAGPGGYETNLSTLLGRPSSKLAQEPRGDLTSRNEDTPGVGNYDMRPSSMGPSHRFGKALRDGDGIGGCNGSTRTPGPGAYTVSSKMLRVESGKTMSKRTPMLPEDRMKVPGPGTYESYVELIKEGKPQYKYEIL